MFTTRFTELVGCSVPIQQAGMGAVAPPELAAAVSEAGGLGMLKALYGPFPDVLFCPTGGVTPDTALRLARYFGTTPEFWMNLQVSFDLETAKDRELAKVNREVRPKAASNELRFSSLDDRAKPL